MKCLIKIKQDLPAKDRQQEEDVVPAVSQRRTTRKTMPHCLEDFAEDRRLTAGAWPEVDAGDAAWAAEAGDRVANAECTSCSPGGEDVVAGRVFSREIITFSRLSSAAATDIATYPIQLIGKAATQRRLWSLHSAAVTH